MTQILLHLLRSLNVSEINITNMICLNPMPSEVTINKLRRLEMVISQLDGSDPELEDMWRQYVIMLWHKHANLKFVTLSDSSVTTGPVVADYQPDLMSIETVTDNDNGLCEVSEVVHILWYIL